MTLIMQIQNSNLKPLPGSVVVNGPGLKKAEIGRETFFLIDTTEAGPGRLFIDAYYEEGKKLNFQLQEQLTGVLTFTYTPPSPTLKSIVQTFTFQRALFQSTLLILILFI